MAPTFGRLCNSILDRVAGRMSVRRSRARQASLASGASAPTIGCGERGGAVARVLPTVGATRDGDARRVLVADEHELRARELLEDAGLGHELRPDDDR